MIRKIDTGKEPTRWWRWERGDHMIDWVKIRHRDGMSKMLSAATTIFNRRFRFHLSVESE